MFEESNAPELNSVTPVSDKFHAELHEEYERTDKQSGARVIRQRRRPMRSIISGLILFAMFLGLVVIPFQSLRADEYKLTDEITIKISGPHSEAEAKKLGEILQFLSENYYRELSTDEILEAMGRGILETQDTPWTYYMPAEDYQQMQETMSGEYSGIGASVQQETDGRFKIIDPVENSPAANSGLIHGDYIVKVGDTDASTFQSAAELANVVRGEIGTVVTLEIFRPSTSETIVFEITRDKIESVTVRSDMLEDNVGYLHLREFTTNLPEQFETHLTNLVDQGAEDFIFDLRHNPGGDAWALRQVVDMLLDEAVISRIEGRSQGTNYVESWTSRDGKLVSDDARFMILLSRDSASASELFSGALRDNAGAVLIGEETFGKGSGTISFPLNDGSAANITVFRYLLPKGDVVEGEGLKPDYPVEMSEELLQTSIADIPYEDDPFIQKALELLREEPDPTLSRQIDGDDEKSSRDPVKTAPLKP